MAFCISVLMDTFAHINELCAKSLALVFQTQFVTQIIAFWFPESWLMFTHDLLLGMETIKKLDGCRLRPPSRVPQMSGQPLASSRYFWFATHPTLSCRSWSCPFGLSYRNLEYCPCQQVFLYCLDYQNWACWNCQNTCLKQVSLLFGT